MLPFLYQTLTILRPQLRTYASDAFGEITTLELKRQAKNKIIADWSKVNRSPTRRAPRTATAIIPAQFRRSQNRDGPRERQHERGALAASSSQEPRERIDHVPFEGAPGSATILERLQGQTMTRHEFNVFKEILAEGAVADAEKSNAAVKVRRKKKMDSTGRAKGVVREEVELPELLKPLTAEAETISKQKRKEREEAEKKVEMEMEMEMEMQLREDEKSKNYRLELERAMGSAGTDTELWEIFNTILRRDIETALDSKKKNETTKEVNLATLTSTLPHLLQHISSLLEKSFPGSAYILSLLPALRSLGPSAFTLGATTPLFNAHMRCLFHTYADLQGIAEILAEMERDVFEFDEETSRILEEIFDRAARAQRGQYGSAVRMLWRTDRRVRGLEELERWEGIVAERRGRAEARRVEAARREGEEEGEEGSGEENVRDGCVMGMSC